MKYWAILIGCFVAVSANAQGWSIPSKSGQMQFADLVYIETVFNTKGHQAKSDTLPGTGFLLSQDSVVYLVTTKHQLLSVLHNGSLLRIGGGMSEKNVKLVPFNPRSNRKSLLLSAKQDIAIISFKKNRKDLNFLLQLGCVPVPVDSVEWTKSYPPGSSFFLPFYQSFYDNWARHVSAGLSPGTIKAYQNQTATFTINHFMAVSFCGSPVFKDDKIIGMVTHPVALNSIDAHLKNPYQKSKGAVVVKSKYILQLLKKLQQQE